MKGIRWATLFAACMLVMGVALATADDKPAKEAKAKGGDMAATLEANERAIWETYKNRDGAAFLTMVDKDGIMADMNGFSKSSQTPEMMKDIELRSYTLHDFTATMLSKDVYVLTYTANMDASYKGQALPPAPVYCSSIYAKHGSKWIGMFHQETMAMPQDAGAASTH